jgi:hypothetical protein
MKLQTLKIAKLSALVLVASLAATVPVKSMAHDTGHINAEILVTLLPLRHSHQVHQYGHSRYYPHPIKYHHNHKHHKARYDDRRYVHARHHQPKRIVRSYDRYSDNKIIRKHFQ